MSLMDIHKSPDCSLYIFIIQLLEEIENKRLLSLDLAQELMAAAFGRPLPSPGKESVIRTLVSFVENLIAMLMFTKDFYV